LTKSYRSKISGVGLGVPSKVLSNSDLSKIVDTSDEWIVTRTGIKERRIADRENGEQNSTLSIRAAKEALENAGLTPADIDMVICATLTPDTWMPITAARVIDGLGIKKAAGFDLNAACSGFLSSLHVADSLVRSGAQKNILAIGAEVFSSLVDWSDRKTCVLFGDGAGAAIVSRVENGDPLKDSMILASHLYCMPDMEENLVIKSGGSRNPYSEQKQSGDAFNPYVQMRGSEVFKNGSRAMAEAAKLVLEKAGVSSADVKWFIPHQANLRIIEMVAKLAEIPMDKVYVNLDRWGNTSAATVAIAMAEMNRKQLLNKGDLILLDVFGGGYTYGAMLLRW